jgi:hypothetical protein
VDIGGKLWVMDPRRIASIAAVVGGVGWLMKVLLIWGNGGVSADTGPVPLMHLIGLVMLALALAAAGYTLVERAPVWLRGVVAIATPLLVLMLWQLLDQGVKAVYPGDSWLRNEVSVLVAAAVAIAMGSWESRRYRSAVEAAPPPPAPVRGRRAAR